MLFRFADVTLNPEKVQELASVEFKPTIGDEAKEFALSKFLGSTTPGANFPIGNGLGVAVTVMKTSPGELKTDLKGPHIAFVRIQSVSLGFSAQPRHDNTVD